MFPVSYLTLGGLADMKKRIGSMKAQLLRGPLKMQSPDDDVLPGGIVPGLATDTLADIAQRNAEALAMGQQGAERLGVFYRSQSRELYAALADLVEQYEESGLLEHNPGGYVDLTMARNAIANYRA